MQVSLSVSTVDAVTVRKGLTAVTKPSREVAWRGPARFAARIHETLVELHQLVVIGDPSCVSLAEHAVLCVDKALGQFSEADPDMDALREEVRGLHLDACHALPPKPVALAARLVELAEKTERDWLQDAPERYRDLLGDEGLAALDKILTRKLEQMPPDSRAALSHTGLALRAMSESLARALGDIDRLVRELAHDLATPARYVRIAQELDTARRRDDALEWLQRGVAEHGSGDDALREALVIAYLHADRRSGRHRPAAGRAPASPECAADGRVARRRGRGARCRAHLGARPARGRGGARGRRR